MSAKRQKLLKEISERLKTVRKRNYLTIEQMRRRLGVSRDCYYKNEIGSTMPALEVLEVFRREFDISVEWLLFGQEPMNLSELGRQEQSG